MKRVLVITNNLNQASFRLRIQELIVPLQSRGITLDIKVRPRGLFARRALLRTAGDYDSTILQRKLLDPSDARLLARTARRLFFDVDDAVMYGNGPSGPFERWRNWRRFCATAKNVTTVVAGNHYLADLFRRQGAAAVVLPTVVDVNRYSAKVHSQTNAPRLVWIGSRSTLPYLQQVLPHLEEAAKTMDGLRLLIIADQTLSSKKLPIEYEPWSVAAEAAALARGDVGIAPTPRDRWTEGKCGFKIVQYVAAGLPVIASPVGANAEIVVDNETGLLPADWSTWPEAVIALAGNVDLRTRMGAAGRQRVERDYSLQRAVDFWEKLLTDA